LSLPDSPFADHGADQCQRDRNLDNRQHAQARGEDQCEDHEDDRQRRIPEQIATAQPKVTNPATSLERRGAVNRQRPGAGRISLGARSTERGWSVCGLRADLILPG
jgi:hypothetical protein